MKKVLLHSIYTSKKMGTFFSIVLVSVMMIASANAQKAQPFIYDCVTPGQTMSIDAIITNADASTFYHWQFKTPNTGWVCFINGVNNINGSSFNVTGATGTGANNAPLLNISGASVALENLIVRVAMAHGEDPCSVPAPSQVWGADDQAMGDTKCLRLHVFSNSASCPPNAYLCPGNLLVNTGKFYGGFENSVFDATSDSYSRYNFGGNIAGTDLSFGNGPGHYQDINNPYAMNAGFDRNLAPHTGDNQLVIQGSPNFTDRAWYKTIPVTAGRQYSFAIWVARVDNTNPLIELRANNSIIVTADLSTQPIGNWNLVQGAYVALINGTVNFSICNGKAGGGDNFTIDDICLRECSNCSILELHQLYLSASLQKSDVKVKWVAENEMGTTNFVVERSFDGMNFDRLGSKTPSGPVNTPTAYFFTDDLQNIGVHNTLYYRVKAMDTDGRFAYSNVVIIRLGKTATLLAWPVPFIENVNISYNAATNSKLEVSVINALGKTVSQTSFNVSRGLNQLSVNQLQSLSTGMYFVRIVDLGNNEVYMQKISK